MHGATLLDDRDDVLRPAILWNDGRAHAECAELEQRVPASRQITGNMAMPGFTAPKLLWVRKHEPQVFDARRRRAAAQGLAAPAPDRRDATEMSDAAGTLWLDVARRAGTTSCWARAGSSVRICRVSSRARRFRRRSRLTSRAPGALRDGASRSPAAPATTRPPPSASARSNPAQASFSLGTSGVFFVATDGFLANPAQGVHSFCHALPHTWHLMSVMLSAAACLDHTQRLTGMADVPSLLAAAERRGLTDHSPHYLPYLNGERTPHNNPAAKAVFFGLDSGTEPADLAYAVLEGVGQGLVDGIEAVEATGTRADEIVLVGGGSRSDYWAQMLADICNRPLVRREGGDFGPALGAARLARLGIDRGAVDESCPGAAVTGRVRARPETARTVCATPAGFPPALSTTASPVLCRPVSEPIQANRNASTVECR